MDSPEVIEYDVPAGADYAGREVDEIGYNYELDRVYLTFRDDTLSDGWDALIFGARVERGKATVTRFPAGLVPPERLPKDGHTPGGQESRRVYELLESVGVSVSGFNE